MGEAAGVLATVAVAVAVRIPYLWDVPRFTDETDEAFRAMLIVQGRLLALTNVDPYIGPLWNYVLAAAFVVAGPSLYAPRAIVAVFGTLTVVPTYLLGRSLGGRWVGLIGATFLALSPAHIVVNSHIAWSNCTTPFFTTLALWLTLRAIKSEHAGRLIWAGIAWGLAFQTHPTAVLFAPAVAGYVARKRPAWLRTRWPWLATILALVACSPLLIANLRSDFGGVEAGLRVQEQYSAGEALSLRVYARRLAEMIFLLSDSLSGALAEFEHLRGIVNAPLGLVFWVLTLLGLDVMARRGGMLPALALTAFLALLPIVNARFEPSVPKARYVAPLFPLCYVALGMLAVTLFRSAAELAATRVSSIVQALPVAGVARLGVVVALVGLLLAPAVNLRGYYERSAARGRANGDLYQTIAAIQAARQPGERVYVDRGLIVDFTPGGGQVFDHLRFAATVYGWPRQPVDLPKTLDERPAPISGLLVLARASEPLAIATLQLEEVPGGRSEHAEAFVYRVLGPRVAGSAARAAQAQPAVAVAGH